MWATVADVLDITGVDLALTPGIVVQAQGDIELHAGVLDTAVVFERDAEWLKRAVAWQAAWLPGQPGSAERSSVDNVSQEGLTVTYKDEAAVVLAPRARRALKNLSWMGTRSVRLAPARRSAGEQSRRTTDTDPPDDRWSPMARRA
jgi:hypothetical protein